MSLQKASWQKRPSDIDVTEMPDRNYIHATVLPQYTFFEVLADAWPTLRPAVYKILLALAIIASPIVGLAIACFKGF